MVPRISFRKKKSSNILTWAAMKTLPIEARRQSRGSARREDLSWKRLEETLCFKINFLSFWCRKQETKSSPSPTGCGKELPVNHEFIHNFQEGPVR